VNTRLEEIRLYFKQEFRRLIAEKIMPSRAMMKDIMDQKFFDFLLSDRDLAVYFQGFIDRINTNKLMTNKGKPYQPGTIKTFNTALRHIKEFAKVYDGRMDLGSIDMNFYYQYLDYFYTNNYNTNAIYSPIKRLKQVLRQAEEEGMNVNAAYKSKRFIIPYEQVDKIYHPEEEIRKIYKIKKYKLFDILDVVRDRYILACYTGLRFSDYEQIRKSNITRNSNGSFLKVTSQKTGVTSVIPLNDIVLAILEKYNYQLPRVISNAHFNEHLKTIGEDAGINEEITVITTKGGKRSEESYPKYKLMQTHTARRSFATNMFLKGYPTIEIMKITGHKTEREFLKYIRISSEEVALKISQDPRFNK
jgi:integrase